MKVRAGEVRFDYMNKDLPFSAGNLDVKAGDIIIVETDYGLDMGLLTEDPSEREYDESQGPIKKMIRLATEEDITNQNSQSENEGKAYEVCMEEINKAGLGMKLVNARYSFDSSRVTFCYTAESRVDFRELVRKLASRLQTRIELRQVGVRDEARLFGGFGPCGRRLCCSAFLRNFKSVSIKMAKEQGLPLNPMKISGICGRLFCCLKYEYSDYLKMRKLLPKVGTIIEVGEVKGRVASVNVIKHSVSVQTEGGGWSEVVIDVDGPPPTCDCGGKCNQAEPAADSGKSDDASKSTPEEESAKTSNKNQKGNRNNKRNNNRKPSNNNRRNDRPKNKPNNEKDSRTPDNNKPNGGGNNRNDKKPSPGNDSSKPGDGNDSSKPGPGNDSSKPGPGNDSSKPGPGNDSSKPSSESDNNQPGNKQPSGESEHKSDNVKPSGTEEHKSDSSKPSGESDNNTKTDKPSGD